MRIFSGFLFITKALPIFLLSEYQNRIKKPFTVHKIQLFKITIRVFTNRHQVAIATIVY